MIAFASRSGVQAAPAHPFAAPERHTHPCRAPRAFRADGAHDRFTSQALNAWLAHDRTCATCAPPSPHGCMTVEWYAPHPADLCAEGRRLVQAWSAAASSPKGGRMTKTQRKAREKEYRQREGRIKSLAKQLNRHQMILLRTFGEHAVQFPHRVECSCGSGWNVLTIAAASQRYAEHLAYKIEE